MDAMNEVGDSREQVTAEQMPVRKQVTYFGSGFHETVNATSGVQRFPKVSAQMNSRIGYGRSGAPRPAPAKSARPAVERPAKSAMPAVERPAKSAMPAVVREARQAKQREPVPAPTPAPAPVNTVEAKGKPNKRADVVKKVMKEKGMSMIEASKFVKANGLY